jgi:hypothetical protein
VEEAAEMAEAAAGLAVQRQRPAQRPEQPRLLQPCLNPWAFRNLSKLSPPDLVAAEAVEEAAVVVVVAVAAAAVEYPSPPAAVAEEVVVAAVVSVAGPSARPLLPALIS